MKGNLASAFGDASQRKGSPLRSNMPPGRLVSVVAGLVPARLICGRQALSQLLADNRPSVLERCHGCHDLA